MNFFNGWTKHSNPTQIDKRDSVTSGIRMMLGFLVVVAAFAWLRPNVTAQTAPVSIAIVEGAEDKGPLAFDPNRLTVKVGDRVTWTNLDSTSHATAAQNGAWNSGPFGGDQQFSVTFTAKGTYPYRCTIHPRMTGVIEVR